MSTYRSRCRSLARSLCLLFLGLAAFAPRAAADLACPNTRACQVDARIESQGDEERCGIGLTLFGFDISIGGPKCPKNRIVYPAHQECHGAANGGTRCVPEQELPVTREKCECERVTVLGTGFSVPECDCEFDGNIGEIEDFKTERCLGGRPPPPPQPPDPEPPADGGGSQ